MTADSRAPRPGRPIERRTGRYWREVCSCGWVGTLYGGHKAAVRRNAPWETWRNHSRERYGWYADLEATTPARLSDVLGDD